jgi:DNA repair ATPase RecN
MLKQKNPGTKSTKLTSEDEGSKHDPNRVYTLFLGDVEHEDKKSVAYALLSPDTICGINETMAQRVQQLEKEVGQLKEENAQLRAVCEQSNESKQELPAKTPSALPSLTKRIEHLHLIIGQLISELDNLTISHKKFQLSYHEYQKSKHTEFSELYKTMHFLQSELQKVESQLTLFGKLIGMKDISSLKKEGSDCHKEQMLLEYPSCSMSK